VEGLNNRLQGMVKERTRAGLEAFVHELKKEADFFDKVITNEQVFKKTHDTNVRKHLKKKKTKLQQITSSHRARSHHSGITDDKDTTTATTTSTSSSITSTTIATSPILFQLTDSLEDPLYDDLFSDKTSSGTDITDLILLQPVHGQQDASLHFLCTRWPRKVARPRKGPAQDCSSQIRIRFRGMSQCSAVQIL
jgi:hypothetical protein